MKRPRGAIARQAEREILAAIDDRINTWAFSSMYVSSTEQLIKAMRIKRDQIARLYSARKYNAAKE